MLLRTTLRWQAHAQRAQAKLLRALMETDDRVAAALTGEARRELVLLIEKEQLIYVAPAGVGFQSALANNPFEV